MSARGWSLVPQRQASGTQEMNSRVALGEGEARNDSHLGKVSGLGSYVLVAKFLREGNKCVGATCLHGQCHC